MAIAEGISKDSLELWLDAVVSRWTKWKQGRQAKETIWEECFANFISQFSDTTEIEEFRSQRFIPVSFEAILNVQSQMGKGLFPNSDYFAALGDNPTAQQYEQLRTLYMRNRMEAANFVEEYVSSHLLQLCVLGNSPSMKGWETRRRRSRQTYQVENPDGGMETRFGFQYQQGGESKEYSISPYIYDGPSFKTLDLFNYVRSPYADDTSVGEIQIYRSKISKEQLLDEAETDIGGYSPWDLKAVKRLLNEDEEAPREKSDSDADSRREAFGIQTSEEDEDNVEILFACGDFAIDGELHKDYVVGIGNRKEVIRCEESPYKFGLPPLNLSTLIPVKGMPYGLGILEASTDLQEVINIRTNQCIDVNALAINPPLKVVDDGVHELDDLVWKPGAMIFMDDVNNLEAMSLPTAAFAGYNEVNLHKAEFVDATFSHKNFGAQSREQTATEVATSAGMMATVLGRFIQRCENRDLEDILLWFDEVEKQFYDPNSEVFARYSESEIQPGMSPFASITPEVIYQSYTWKAMGSGFTHLAQIRLQQLQQWTVTMAQTPAAMDIDWMEVGKAALRDMGRRDTDKLLPGRMEMMRRGQLPIPGQTGQEEQGQGEGAGEGPIPAGSRNPPGLAPSRRGAIPNAGGAAPLMAAGLKLPIG